MNYFSKIVTLVIFASFFTFVKSANSQCQLSDPCLEICPSLTGSAQERCVREHCGGKLPTLCPGVILPPITDPPNRPDRPVIDDDGLGEAKRACESRGPDYVLGPDRICRDTSIWRVDYLD